MKIALLGYGKMGKMIERIAQERGHEIILTVDDKNREDFISEKLKQADVAIEFTMPDVAVDNYKWCMECGVSVVSGTTGWLEQWEEVKKCVKEKNGGFFYASNFSIGVNIFFRLNKYLAKMMNGFSDYRVFIEETHHIHKMDAPSGTAITLAEGILDNLTAYHSWKLDEGMPMEPDTVPVTAKRIGEVPGIHGVTYKSAVDEIEIRHSAFSREGFAQGAVLAAEFMVGKKGLYNMDDLLSDKLSF
ncbi:MAG: 4-hydroxy-tetrahydrodipicolinate reductase [Odoribacter sp.]|nr:4-hydroxy-tetrahydrodipicolinate reductase [Odoribacter sp.]